MTFSCRNLSIKIAGKTLLKNLDFTLKPGDVLCVLGQNGSGKSTLLHALSGLSYTSGGHVEINQQLTTSFKRKQLAQRLGLVTQTHDDPFPISVFDFALAGRHPYLGLMDWESTQDRKLTEQALLRTHLLDKRDQLVQTLSGGERKRLSIARILVQDPDIMLWDEPTNHLDPAQQKHVLSLVKELQQEGKIQIIALHDINHASRIATDILFMYEDDSWAAGKLDDMLVGDKLEALYKTGFMHMQTNERSIFSLN